jgi:hypothetical protein
VSPSQQRPKLEIPVSQDMMSPTKIRVTIKYDDPKELEPKQEGWSPTFMYAMDLNGVEHVLFASPKLHEMIQETGAIKGTEVALARVGTEQATRWGAEYISGPRRATNGQEDPAPTSPSPQPAQPPAPSQNSQPPAPTPVPARQFFYVPMSNTDLFEAMLQDINTVRSIAHSQVERDHPASWDDLEPHERETLISTTATGNTITLGNHLRSMAGGWNEPSGYAAFNGWGVADGEEVNQADDNSEAFSIDDPRWPDVRAVRQYQSDGERKISLARAIALHDDKIKAYQHAGAILSRFGYDAAGVDSEVHWQMAEMVWMYEGLRSEGATQNDALKLTAETFNHPLDLLNWFDEDPEPKASEVSGMGAEVEQPELGGSENSDGEELADEMAF